MQITHLDPAPNITNENYAVDGAKWNKQHAVTWGVGENNLVLGASAGQSISTGVNNTYVGAGAGRDTTSGLNNVALGYVALALNTDGANNVGVGVNALASNTSGYSLTAIGYNAGAANRLGDSNTFVGSRAGEACLDANCNVYIGAFAGVSELGQANDYVGYKAGYSSTEGDRNAFFGNSAGFDNTTGDDNVCLGYNSGNGIQAGSGNVSIGSGAIGGAGVLQSVAIGYQTTVTGNYAVAIGPGVDNGLSNTVMIGNSNLAGVRFGGSGAGNITLGSGGVNFWTVGGSAGSGYLMSTTATGDGSTLGFVEWGAPGTGDAEKRGASIRSTLVGSAISTVSADLAFWTNNAGTFAKRGSVTPAGALDMLGSIKAHSGTAIPAHGTAGVGVLFSSTTDFGIFFGSDTPTFAAAKGSLYLRSDGSSTSTRLYVNSDGSTGWVAVTTAS